MSYFIDCDSISCQFWLFSLGSGCSGTELGVAVGGTRPHPILFHPVFVFLLPPGLLGGFPLSAGPLHLLPGFLHGRPVRSTQDPPVHCPGEGHPCSGLSGKWGVLKFIENLFLFTSEYVQINLKATLLYQEPAKSAAKCIDFRSWASTFTFIMAPRSKSDSSDFMS